MPRAGERHAPCFSAPRRRYNEVGASAVLEIPIGVRHVGLRRQVDETRDGQRFAQSFEIAVAVEFDLRPVVEAGAPHCALVETEARRADYVQRRARRRAQARDVPRIGRYLRLDECDVEHGRRSAFGSQL